MGSPQRRKWSLKVEKSNMRALRQSRIQIGLSGTLEDGRRSIPSHSANRRSRCQRLRGRRKPSGRPRSTPEFRSHLSPARIARGLSWSQLRKQTRYRESICIVSFCLQTSRGFSLLEQPPVAQPIGKKSRPCSEHRIFQVQPNAVRSFLEDVHLGRNSRLTQRQIKRDRVLGRNHGVGGGAEKKSRRCLRGVVQLSRQLPSHPGAC